MSQQPITALVSMQPIVRIAVLSLLGLCVIGLLSPVAVAGETNTADLTVEKDSDRLIPAEDQKLNTTTVTIGAENVSEGISAYDFVIDISDEDDAISVTDVELTAEGEDGPIDNTSYNASENRIDVEAALLDAAHEPSSEVPLVNLTVEANQTGSASISTAETTELFDKELSQYDLGEVGSADLPVEDASYYNVSIDDVPETVTEGDEFAVDTTVTNLGTLEDNQSVALEIDNSIVASSDVSLQPGDSELVELTNTIDNAGNVTLGVSTDNQTDQKNLTVEQTVGSGTNGGNGGGNGGGGGGGGGTGVPSIAPSDVNPPEGVGVASDVQGMIRTDEDGAAVSFGGITDEPVATQAVFEREDIEGETRTRDYDGVPDDATDPPGDAVSVTEIVVPPTYEDESATVTFDISHAEHAELDVDAIDTDYLTVWHYTGDEWSALETTAISSTEIQAETPGFSYFAVTDQETATDIDPEDEDEDDVEEEVDDSIPGFGVVITVLALTLFVGLKTVYRP